MFQNGAYKSVVIVPACLILMGSDASAQFFSFFRSPFSAQGAGTPVPEAAPAARPQAVPQQLAPQPNLQPKPKPRAKPTLVATTQEEARNTQLVSSQMAELARKYGLEMAFRLDPTLRRGDVVVVNSGLHVFAGERGRSHRVSDFRALAHSEFAKKPQLAALQKVGSYEAIAPGARSAFTEVLIIRPSSRFLEVKASYGFKEVKAARK